MKSLIKFIIFCAILYFAANYLEKHDIYPVREKMGEAGKWIKEQYLELKTSIENKSESSAVESSGGSESTDRVNETLPEPVNNGDRIVNRTTYSSGGTTESEPKPPSGENENTVNSSPEKTEPDEYANKDSFGFPEDNLEWVKAVTKKYSPDCWYLLMQYDNLPSNAQAPSVGGLVASSQKSAGTFAYLSGNSRGDLLSRMSTNVHEIAHGFCGLNVYRYANENAILLDWDKTDEYIYVSPSEAYYISFPKKSLFPSARLVPVIPYNLRTFRFDDYINGNTSTQQEGVFGLLDELHAYYLGSKNNFDLLEARKMAEGSDHFGFFTWVQHAQSEMSAFYEFDFFIKEYLLYMKENYNADYLALKSYRPFRDAYNSVRTVYKNLVIDYENKINSEISRINSSGRAECWLKDGHLWVREKNSLSSEGTSTFSEARPVLSPVLEGDKFTEIESDFRLK